MFGANLPTLNIRGELSIKTYTGGLASMVIMVITLFFAILKLQHLLMKKKNPTISKYVQEGAITAEDRFTLAG